MASTFVLDTCVLLADPHSPLRFHEHDVVLPLVVVEELDRKKTRMDEVGANARSAIRLLEELGASKSGGMREPVRLPGGGTLRIELNGVYSDRLPSVLDPGTPDHRILSTCLNLQESTGAVLVTKDASFADDLDADSLDLVELVMRLEEEFDISVDESELEGVETVQQALDLVSGKI